MRFLSYASNFGRWLSPLLIPMSILVIFSTIFVGPLVSDDLDRHESSSLRIMFGSTFPFGAIFAGMTVLVICFGLYWLGKDVEFKTRSLPEKAGIVLFFMMFLVAFLQIFLVSLEGRGFQLIDPKCTGGTARNHLAILYDSLTQKFAGELADLLQLRLVRPNCGPNPSNYWMAAIVLSYRALGGIIFALLFIRSIAWIRTKKFAAKRALSRKIREWK